MKSLILIRHAKSSWDERGLSDIERPLNSRGEKNAPLIGSILRDKYAVVPDIILTSPARRAKQTALIIAGELNYPGEKIKEIQKLYSAATPELLNVIHSLNEEYQTVIITGHNPELTELSNTLSGKYIDNIPTCGVVKFSVETAWKDVKQKNCRLDFFIYPKLFKTTP